MKNANVSFLVCYEFITYICIAYTGEHQQDKTNSIMLITSELYTRKFEAIYSSIYKSNVYRTIWKVLMLFSTLGIFIKNV